MKRILSSALLALAAAASLTAAPAPAHAFKFPPTVVIRTGTVTGQLLFFQNQGNFCPTGRDCSGANYLQSAFNTNQPLSDTLVYLLDAGGATVGQGVTDGNGSFNVSWSTLGNPSQLRVAWQAEHKDGRFTIRQPGGQSYQFTSSAFSVAYYADTPVGQVVFGSSGMPNPVANAYDGGWRMWSYALAYSNRMLNNFTGVDVRAFSNTAPNSCPTSCANGGTNIVQLDTNAAFAPQARIMHEFGHIASYKSNPFRFANDTSWPAAGGTQNGWTLAGPEWKWVQFEEGMATFFGDVALYWGTALAPHTCLVSAAACSTDQLNTESSGAFTGCATNADRFPINVTRYLWDVYDLHEESAFLVGDHTNKPYFMFFDTLATYPAGSGDNDIDEAWNDSFSALDDRDGRAAQDFYDNASLNMGINSLGERSINCAP